MSSASCYCIYGVCGTCDASLFIDYVTEPVLHHETELIHQIEHSPDPTLHAWQVHQHPGVSEVFEIEQVTTQEAAEEAVSFWQAYFRSLGEIIVNGAHVCEVLNNEKPGLS